MMEIERPKIETASLSPDGRYGKFVAEPLERGFGITLGNSLRRVLLSSLPGVAVTSVKIDGVVHEFSTIEGVKEDVTEIVLNLKGIAAKLYTDGPKTVRVEAVGPCEVTADNIKQGDDIEILNPEWHIATLGEGAKLVMELTFDKGRGYVATVLVSNGTLRVGDIMVAGTSYGKIRAMFNERNQRITEAGPAAPALVLGLNGAPTAGDTFNILDTDREAREIATRREQLQREVKERTRRMPGLDDIARRRALGEFHELNLIVKGDVDGSIEALSDSLIKLSTPEVQVNVIHKAVGAISESDVTLAAASDAVIIGFQVRPSVAARRLAENDGVDIRLYSIIYDAIEEVKDAMAGMLSPELKEEVTGTAEVLQTYKISKVGTIAGCMVREGKVKRTSKVRLIRDGIVIYTGELGSLKRFKDDVKEVSSGYDCGLNIANYNDVKEGDMIEAYEEVEVSKTL